MKTNQPNMQTQTNTKTSSKNPKSGSEHGFRSSNHQAQTGMAQQEAEAEAKPFRRYGSLKAFQAMQAAAQWRGILFSGPQAAQDKQGEENPQWTVSIVDKEHAPCSRVYVCHSFGRAESLAQAMSRDRGFELVNEAMPA